MMESTINCLMLKLKIGRVLYIKLVIRLHYGRGFFSVKITLNVTKVSTQQR
jgi:hypothetical protein